MADDTDRVSLLRVGGLEHDQLHRAHHCTLYLPLLRLAFGDESSWGQRTALVLFAGRGREAEFFTPFCRRTILVDNCPACVEVLQRKFCAIDRPDVQAICNAGHDLPGVESGSVDMLVGFVGLMHIRQYSLREGLVSEACRVLRPTGVAVFQVAQGEDWDLEDPEWAYTVDHYGWAPNAGFKTEEAVYDWWAQFFTVDFIVRSPVIPPDASMRNWWWVFVSKGGA